MSCKGFSCDGISNLNEFGEFEYDGSNVSGGNVKRCCDSTSISPVRFDVGTIGAMVSAKSWDALALGNLLDTDVEREEFSKLNGYRDMGASVVDWIFCLVGASLIPNRAEGGFGSATGRRTGKAGESVTEVGGGLRLAVGDSASGEGVARLMNRDSDGRDATNGTDDGWDESSPNGARVGSGDVGIFVKYDGTSVGDGEKGATVGSRVVGILVKYDGTSVGDGEKGATVGSRVVGILVK